MGYYRRRSWQSRDYQRSKVYKWQWSLELDKTRLSGSEINELIKEVCNLYSVPRDNHPNWAYNSRLKAVSRYVPYENTIELARSWGNEKWVVLHEIVHAIQYQLDIRDCWHGPIFAGMLKDVLAMFSGESEERIMAAACRYGVDMVNSPEKLIED